MLDPYQPLPRATATNAPFAPAYVCASLTQCADPHAVYAARVKNRHVLLENPARTSRAHKARVQRTTNTVNNAAPSLARSGLWSLERGLARFELFLPLHALWTGYMSELLNLGHPHPPSPPPPPPPAASMHAKLVKADLHGSLLTVRKSKNPCLVSLSGITIHETEIAFKLVTRDDRLVLIPKRNSVFTLAVPLYSTLPASSGDDGTGTGGARTNDDDAEATHKRTVLDAPHIAFDLHGNHFCFRSADRAGRKFKAKETIEL